MNLFLLDTNPTACARAHCDKHVVKMTLESAQILCSAHWLADGFVGEGWYGLTHKGHPVVRWAAANVQHYRVVYAQFAALAAEYEYRYGREHLSWCKLGKVLEEPPQFIDYGAPVGYVLCMPEEYWGGPSKYVARLDTAVAAYRRYYRGEKQRMFKWTGRDVPDWLLH